MKKMVLVGIGLMLSSCATLGQVGTCPCPTPTPSLPVEEIPLPKVSPTPIPSPTPTPSVAPTPTLTPTPSPSPSPSPTSQLEKMVLYSKASALASGWLRFDWNCGGGEPKFTDLGFHVDLGCGGWNAAVIDQRTEAWQITRIPGDRFTHLSFDIYLARGSLELLNVNLDNGSEGKTGITGTLGAWVHVRLPMAEISQNGAEFFRVAFFNRSGNGGPEFFIDNLALERDASAMPSPAPSPSSVPVTFSINPQGERKPISPLIYGANTSIPRVPHLKFIRASGNSYTTYNWENNANNAGSDWQNMNYDYLGGGNTPGEAVRMRMAQAHGAGAEFMATVPILDFVAADKNGVVSEQASDASTRWVRSLAKKQGSLSLSPDLTDRAVYQDEFVNFIKTQAGTHSLFFSLDNEPGLWNHTHALLHPSQPSYGEMRERSIRYASMIKDVAPEAKVFGAVSYGYYEYVALQGAPDSSQHGDYLEYLMREMRAESERQGRRLMDVLDVHWYPNIQNVTPGQSTNPSPQEAEARIQAPRSLWDPTYREQSWIADVLQGPVQIITRLKDRIRRIDPGLKLAITEYNYGGGDHISGAIAQADVLGIFGREGVYAANWWDMLLDNNRNTFIHGAMNLYVDYDGQGAMVGDLSLPASTSDVEKTSVYAMGKTGSQALYVVAINKSLADVDASIDLGAAKESAVIYRVDSAHAQPSRVGEILISGQRLETKLPARSVSLFVMR